MTTVVLGATACGAQSPSEVAINSATGMATPAMSMGNSGSRSAAVEAGPPEAAAMVCSHEIQLDVRQVTGDTTVAMGTRSWDGTVYRCAYRVAAAQLTMTVRVAKTTAAAKQDYAALLRKFGAVRQLKGVAALGLPAFETDSGVVVFRKGSDTLTVDATKLRSMIGAQQRTRADVAYAVATDVIACWRED